MTVCCGIIQAGTEIKNKCSARTNPLCSLLGPGVLGNLPRFGQVVELDSSFSSLIHHPKYWHSLFTVRVCSAVLCAPI